MTVSTAWNGMLGGTGDILLEVGTENHNSAAWEPAAPQCSISGTAVRFDFTVAGANAHVVTGLGMQDPVPANGYVVTLEIRAVTLGSETAVMAHLQEGYRPIRLGPDGKLRIYDIYGNELGASSSTVSQTIFTHVVLVDDGSRSTRTVHLFIDGVEELAVRAANPVLQGLNGRLNVGWGWGDALEAGSATGTVYELRNALARGFETDAESPRNTRWPYLQSSVRRIPTSEGEIAQWPNGTTPSPNTWQDVDEFPNDGDTTRIADLSSPPGKVHLFRSGDPNPLPAGASVLGVQVSCAGRVAASAKGLGSLLVRLGGQQEASGPLAPTTNYRGFGWLVTTRPDGTAWQRADFDPDVLQFGLQSETAFDPPGSICSNICYQVVYWNSLLPLATEPPAGARARSQVLIV